MTRRDGTVNHPRRRGRFTTLSELRDASQWEFAGPNWLTVEAQVHKNSPQFLKDLVPNGKFCFDVWEEYCVWVKILGD